VIFSVPSSQYTGVAADDLNSPERIISFTEILPSLDVISPSKITTSSEFHFTTF
jgi:hypothetical protein